MSRVDYETELTGSREEVAAALSGVVDSLLAGSIRLDEGDDAVAVDVPADVALEIELETEDDGVSLELELEWDAAEGEAVAPAAGPVAGVPVELPADGGVVGPETDSDSAVVGNDGESDDPVDDEAIETLPMPVGADDASLSLARFELFRDRAAEWRWRLRHHNGNAIATSGEGYTRKHNARKGLRSVMRNAPGASVEEPEGN